MIPVHRSGFVLLEAVVALAILGMASIVLLQVRAQQIRVATQARELLTAQALAEDRSVPIPREPGQVVTADQPIELLGVQTVRSGARWGESGPTRDLPGGQRKLILRPESRKKRRTLLLEGGRYFLRRKDRRYICRRIDHLLPL